MSNELGKLLDLPASTLLELGNSLRGGSLRYGVTPGILATFVGGRASEMATLLQAVLDDGCSPVALGGMCLALHTVKARMEFTETSLHLALSGPDVPGTPVVSTPTMVRALFEEAKQDVIVASYVFFQCKALLDPLAERMNADSNFKVRFIVDLSHQRKYSTEPLPIIANRFRSNFLGQLWSANRAPEFWHDPRVFPGARSQEGGCDARQGCDHRL